MDSCVIFQQSLFGFAAKQATSPADLVGKLSGFGFSSTDTHAFAEEIFSRVPHRSSGLNVSLWSKAQWKYTAIGVYLAIPFLYKYLVSAVYWYPWSVSAISETRERSCNVGEEAEDLHNFEGWWQ